MDMKSVTTQGRSSLFRKPRRINATVPEHVYEMIVEVATKEGRSMSNLVAFALERWIEDKCQS
jgi:UDP-N-acetyl-D-mannosaminuronate dehydrogenase